MPPVGRQAERRNDGFSLGHSTAKAEQTFLACGRLSFHLQACVVLCGRALLRARLFALLFALPTTATNHLFAS
jgi:hypothetical protein